jgi:hypothetical protein
MEEVMVPLIFYADFNFNSGEVLDMFFRNITGITLGWISSSDMGYKKCIQSFKENTCCKSKYLFINAIKKRKESSKIGVKGLQNLF